MSQTIWTICPKQSRHKLQKFQFLDFCIQARGKNINSAKKLTASCNRPCRRSFLLSKIINENKKVHLPNFYAIHRTFERIQVLNGPVIVTICYSALEEKWRLLISIQYFHMTMNVAVHAVRCAISRAILIFLWKKNPHSTSWLEWCGRAENDATETEQL